MKYIGIFIGLFVLSFFIFLFVGLIIGPATNSVGMDAIIVLGMQNIAVITLLIFIAQKLTKK